MELNNEKKEQEIKAMQNLFAESGYVENRVKHHEAMVELARNLKLKTLVEELLQRLEVKNNDKT